ncbi:hypothetical protein B0H16DRAFT_1551424 [Mycena metata]|uniref:DUF6699 domain-containing protein n=1 Tax=Mycena metata TaxID=1033252 RepID=A0AAD7IS78_9AGAR|nr:hypothetical protein B0H16DRAFT_1551424 [Mycena metata]
MSTPFVYVPEASPTIPQWHNPFYSTPQAGPSPFLPPAHLYPSSPYSGPGTPENFNANSVLWPESAPQQESAYAPSWAPLSNRQRTTSWHGPASAVPNSPFLQPAAPPAFLTSQSGYFTPGHRRSSSWGAANAPPPPSWATVPQRPTQIHPWLNGDAPSPIFHFDLAPGEFAPLRQIRAHPPQGGPLSAAEIREPAFHPPITALRILHPRIPFWPVDLALHAELAAQNPTPISLGDVLVSLHRAMHERISHADWETLSTEDAQAVTKAFTHRCRSEAVRSGALPAQLRDREVAERNKGVKRVDFLLGKTVFKGLFKDPEDPEGCVRMITV